MSVEKGPGAGEATELRMVVDAQIALAMFLARRDDPAWGSAKRQLLRLLTSTSFHRLWSPDVVADYERSAAAVEADERLARRAVFDRPGFRAVPRGAEVGLGREELGDDAAQGAQADQAGPARRGAGP